MTLNVRALGSATENSKCSEIGSLQKQRVREREARHAVLGKD